MTRPLQRKRSDHPGVFSYQARGKRRWGIEYLDLRGKERRRVGFKTKELAIAARALEARKRAGVRPEAGEQGIPFRELVTRFLRHQTTSSYYHERSKVWLRFFGGADARGISAEDVAKMRTARLLEVGPTTVRKDLVSLSTLFRWGMRAGLLTANPAGGDAIARPGKPSPRPNPLTPAEETRLLAELPDWLRPVVELGLATGADRGELLALRWREHVDEADQVLVVPRAKTGVGRRLPYAGNATVVRILLEARLQGAETVFSVGPDRQPISLEAARSAMRRAWSRAGLAPTATHAGKTRPWKSLRATFASRKVAAGVAIPVIARLMGLTSAHVLEHYVQPFDEQLAEGMAAGSPPAKPRRSARARGAHGA